MKIKTILILLWIAVIVVHVSGIVYFLINGENIGAIVLSCFFAMALYFLLSSGVESPLFPHKYEEVDVSSAPSSCGVSALGIAGALIEERTNFYLKYNRDKIVRQQGLISKEHPAYYRHRGMSKDKFVSSFQSLTDKKLVDIYDNVGGLGCSNYAIQMFVKSTGRFPTPSEDMAIQEDGFDAWFLKNFINLLGGEQESKVHQSAEHVYAVNEEINNLKSRNNEIKTF